MVQDGASLFLAAAAHGLTILWILITQNGRRQQGGVDGAGPADGQRRHRDAGRHLHDRQQRIEAVQRLDSTGTPSTGSIVLAAAMPGRWAAPPAPAISTSSPRASADPAYSNSRSGVRWADTTRVS